MKTSQWQLKKVPLPGPARTQNLKAHESLGYIPSILCSCLSSPVCRATDLCVPSSFPLKTAQRMENTSPWATSMMSLAWCCASIDASSLRRRSATSSTLSPPPANPMGLQAVAAAMSCMTCMLGRGQYYAAHFTCMQALDRAGIQQATCWSVCRVFWVFLPDLCVIVVASQLIAAKVSLAQCIHNL